MSKERDKLLKRMSGIKDKVVDLRNQYVLLQRQELMLSDELQQFKEGPETFGRGRSKRTALIGRIHWQEHFADEDTGEIITIERSQAVMVDGEWIVELGF